MAALGTCLQVLTASNRSSDNNVIVIVIHFNGKKYIFFCKLRKVRLQTFGRCEIPTHDKFPSYFYNERTSCR